MAAAVLAVVVVGVVIVITTSSGSQSVAGHAESRPTSAPTAPSAQTRQATPTSPQPTVAPLVQQPNWTTLSNPASGLSYQIPPTNWSTNPTIGPVGSVTLAQGAERTAYTCGNPPERLLRGILGSGSAPKIDPVGLADALAQAAATLYYSTGNHPPTVTVDPAMPVQRKTANGTMLHGVLVRAIAAQHADSCLASQGELLVFVLQFADHDGVLLVNADIAGGPASPVPATDRELRAIVGTATPTS